MNGVEIVRGHVSVAGRLERADPLLLALQEEAGGTLGGSVAVPALAHLTRVTQRLGMMVARPLAISAKDRDISCWVRIKPGPDGAEITILEWQERPRRTDPVDQIALAAHGAMFDAGWDWHVDARLQFLSAATGTSLPHAAPQPGEPLSSYFKLIESDGDERLPLLAGMAARRPFAGQSVAVRRGGSLYSLAGLPLFDARRRLIGYRGRAVSAAQGMAFEPTRGQEPAGYSPLFNRRLDHALRQPLGRIVANADSISSQNQGPVRADYARYAADIAQAGRHLIELVDDLGDLQAVERADFVVAQEDVDIADLGRRAAGLLKMRAAERNIGIEMPDAHVRVVAIAEYRRVLQILVNLIGNAVRHCGEGAAIDIRVASDPGENMVGLIVADDGPGIDAADHARIFQRFERLAPEDGVGSGLGLYISRRLARAMGGDILVESALGQGARFTLILPAWPAEA